MECNNPRLQSNDELYYAIKSDAWESVKIDSQSAAPSIALSPSGDVHISYSGDVSSGYRWSTKYTTNAGGEWLIKKVDPYEGLPEHFTEKRYSVAGFGGKNSIAIDSDGSAHITYQAWLDMTQNILR